MKSFTANVKFPPANLVLASAFIARITDRACNIQTWNYFKEMLPPSAEIQMFDII